MQSIKMIVTDLDGTLLRTDKTVSERTIAALTRCKQSGIKLAYATGRGKSAANLVPEGLFDGRIIANGAMATVDDTVVYNSLIPYLSVRNLLMACDKRGLRMSSQFDGMDYSNFSLSAVWPEETSYTIVDFSKHDKDTEKIFTYDITPDDLVFMEAHLPPEAYLVTAVDGVAMINHKNAIKSKATAELARYWGIAASEVAAFGDDLNDLDLLKFAGVGVAMGNALDVVKEVAGHICQTNDEDGLARWIEANL